MNYDDWKLDNGPHELSDETTTVCDAIEDDQTLTLACNTAEAICGASLDCNRLETVIRNDTLNVRTWIGLEWEVDPGNPQQDLYIQQAATLREIARQIERRTQTEPAEALVQPRFDWLYAAVLSGLALMSFLVWRVW